MPPRIARLAGLGAFGACAGLLALLALVVLGTRPTPFSGMDSTTRTMTWVALGGVLIALIAVHVLLGKKLLDVAKERRELP